jgi:hypothetical protein
MSEFNEPWECGFEHESMCQIWSNGKTIFRIESSRLVGEECPGKYGERIVACVNACKGFTTEQLEAAAKGEALCIIGNSKELCEIIQNAPDEGFIAYQSSPQYFTDGSSPGEKPTVGPLGDIAREILALDGDE